MTRARIAEHRARVERGPRPGAEDRPDTGERVRLCRRGFDPQKLAEEVERAYACAWCGGWREVETRLRTPDAPEVLALAARLGIRLPARPWQPSCLACVALRAAQHAAGGGEVSEIETRPIPGTGPETTDDRGQAKMLEWLAGLGDGWREIATRIRDQWRAPRERAQRLGLVESRVRRAGKDWAVPCLEVRLTAAGLAVLGGGA